MCLGEGEGEEEDEEKEPHLPNRQNEMNEKTCTCRWLSSCWLLVGVVGHTRLGFFENDESQCSTLEAPGTGGADQACRTHCV